MKSYFILAGFLFVMLAPSGVFANELKTVKLEVGNLSCPSCPYIVKGVLSRVPGVNNVSVSFIERSATVTFDDSKTNINELMKSIYNQGYPSRLFPEGG